MPAATRSLQRWEVLSDRVWEGLVKKLSQNSEDLHRGLVILPLLALPGLLHRRGKVVTDSHPFPHRGKKGRGGENQKSPLCHGCHWPGHWFEQMAAARAGTAVSHERLRTASGSGSSPQASDNARGPGPALESAGWDRLTPQLCLQPGERAENRGGHAEKRQASPRCSAPLPRGPR